MKLFLRLSLTAIAVTLFFSTITVTETKAQQLNEILKRMETHRLSLTSLRTGVKMVKYNAQLKTTDLSDITEGTAIYLPAKGRDALIRIDWRKPEETLAVVEGKYVIYRPRLNQAIIGNVKNAKGSSKANSAFAFLNMSKEQLKTNYTVKYLGQENVSGSIPTWHLEMMPKNAASYKSAEMWVDGNGMPIQIKITENNNDTNTIYLSNIEKNVAINASKFKVNLPKTVQRIDG
jgi:outer membrane lipoprotein-sorting protein